ASAGFTNRYIQYLEPVICAFVEQLLDNVDGEFDLIKDLAEPLPAMVIAEMMGVPANERHYFLDWSHDLTGATIVSRPDLIRKASVAEREMRRYLHMLVEQKRTQPADDFISRLVQAEVEHDQLTRDEVVSTCILLLSAGHETTTRLIGNGLYTLFRHPEQLQQLRDDRSLMENAIEEMLRYEPPVQMTIRFLARDLEFCSHRMKAGQMVLVNLAAANRDPHANPDPDTFDITRPSVNHIAFGYGIHLCLGLSLARLEARIVFNSLLDRFPDLACAETDPSWQGNPFFRGLDRLQVRTTSGPT
ncbi:MAG: cytochrome P450, partial [Pseudomonadales bacterium]|nr:cytochrome P450 [Pseudomonadales bacterium]